jgi:moderate conductance mechanosensitive channel
MPEPFNHWLDLTIPNVLRLLGILVIALVLNRLLRALSNLIIKPATTQTRQSQLREQQTRTLAGIVYSAGSKVVWAVALLTSLREFKIDITPAVTLAGLASLAVGFGAQTLVRDVIMGFYIVLEDQYVVGDTVQISDYIGRVEHLTLRRTVIRNAAGAIVTMPNSLIGQVANLSRDWSQAFVDVTVPAEEMVGRALATLEKIAGDFRTDSDWSPAIVDGPRVLGVESLSLDGTVIRLQVRTILNRKEDVARELRRRIKMGFEQSRIPLSHTYRVALQGELPQPPQ